MTEPPPWSKRRWIWTVVSVLAGQLALVWLLSDWAPMVPRQAAIKSTLHLVTDERDDQQLAESLITSDPTLFALPNTHNFSGLAWLKLPPTTNQIPNWTDSSPGLRQSVDELGVAFLEFLRAKAPDSLLVAQKPQPRWLDILVPDEPLTTQSVVRVKGDLANRPLISSLNPPAWPSGEVLLNSIVHVVVNASGEPLTVQLWSGCGQNAADQLALRLAKTARFQPVRVLEDNSLFRDAVPRTYGTLIFQWATTSTNITQPNPKP